MSLQALVQSMTPDVYQRLKLATEIGKWPDGTPLSTEQRESSLQAVMAYQSMVLKSEEHFSVGADGEIVSKSKSELKKQFKDEALIASFDADDM